MSRKDEIVGTDGSVWGCTRQAGGAVAVIGEGNADGQRTSLGNSRRRGACYSDSEGAGVEDCEGCVICAGDGWSLVDGRGRTGQVGRSIAVIIELHDA